VEVEVQFYAFLTSALIGGKLEAPVAFPLMHIDYEVQWVPETAWTFWRSEYLTPAIN
jgi:hypothetical protein